MPNDALRAAPRSSAQPLAARLSVFLVTLVCVPFPLHAQQTASTLPDAPGYSTSAAETQAADPQHEEGQQTSRILGIIPNFRAVSVDQHLPPQSIGDKFITATQDSFDYSSLFLPVSLAAINYERNNTPEFGQGGVGYGRYLWHTAADQTIENYMVEFVVPSVMHEDTRYYTLGRGGFLKRTGYALSRAAITRSDSGRTIFNTGEVLGAGAAAGISNLYYPSPERTVGNTMSQWGLNVGIDAGTFVFKEFWPDINHALFRGRP